MFRRTLGSPALFVIIWTSLASAIYFSLGIVAKHALGLTPLVFLLATGFFVLTAFTYMEGAGLHPERAGASVFARFAFNELVSFLAGWAILLDFLILIAVTAYSATNYLAVFWKPIGSGTLELIVAAAIILYVALRNIQGFSSRRAERVTLLVIADLAIQLALIVIAGALFFDPSLLIDSIDLGKNPTWEGFVFALTIGTVAFTCLESASSVSGEVGITVGGVRKLLASASISTFLVYVGVSTVALMALPVVGNETSISRNYLDAPLIGVVEVFEPAWLAHWSRYVIAFFAVTTLIAASSSAMLGLSRLAYSLSTNRQIPRSLGRLHATRSTPYVVILIAAALAIGLVLPESLEFLVGIYAFGALFSFTVAHVSVCVLRFREPTRPRPIRIPLNISIKGKSLPLPAIVGSVVSAAAFLSLMIFHSGARYVGLGWMFSGALLYVIYRKAAGKPLTQRIVVPDAVLRKPTITKAEYGSILVPIFGTPIDDDLMQTAGRLASEDQLNDEGVEGATVEALAVLEVPMSLPIDAQLPEQRLKDARIALARAKEVGEEYAGVTVATATVRARNTGRAIVDEARRRGVEVIVMAAEAPSRIGGGVRLGGSSGPADRAAGTITRYVVAKAACRVLLTVPPADDKPVSAGNN